MKVAIVGVSGVVGQVMLKVLEERNFSIDKLLPVASEKSIGKSITFKGTEHKIIAIQEAIKQKPDIALFSAGASVSLEFAPKFSEVGCFVVDNSSAWRMDENKKLIVPEINGNILTPNDRIIANPNCSTIQMLLPLSELHKQYIIKRIVVSTYQSISGSGQKAIQQFEAERKGESPERVYPYQIDRNCLAHCDDFVDNAYTKEEMKLVNETQKIFNSPNIKVTATAVRVPVTGGHSESVNIEFENDFSLSDVREIISNTKGVSVQDDIQNQIYPMPINAQGKDDVFVGRIRKDFSQDRSINLWIVADNLRKGAATNTVQIAELLVKKGFIA